MGTQETVHAFLARHGLRHSPDVHALDLVSEVGEVAKALLEASGYGRVPPSPDAEPTAALVEELGDSCFSLLALADSLGVDLEAALAAAMCKYEARLASKGHSGSGPESRPAQAGIT